jgi:uncharacterized protein (DUF433 family)
VRRIRSTPTTADDLGHIHTYPYTYLSPPAARFRPQRRSEYNLCFGGDRPRPDVHIMTIHQRIEMNPDVMLGKPVIRGTRVPVELIVRKVAEGASEAALLDAYPRLTRDDIRAALLFAADSLAHEDILLDPAV